VLIEGKDWIKIKKKGPCRNKGRLPKLTAYEKNLNFLLRVLIYKYKWDAKNL